MAVRFGWSRAGLRVAFLTCAAASLACGGEGPAQAPAPLAPPPPAPPAPAPFELHEWGLIASSTGSDTQQAVSAAGTVGGGPLGVLGQGGGLMQGMGAIGKPVLYFHLDEGTDALDLRVGVSATGGHVVEHFPAGILSDEGAALSWPQVHLTRGACRGTYPSRADPACQTPDGLCEAAEIAAYESATADCVQVGAQRGGVLLYRTGPSTAGLPLAVTVDDAGQLTVRRVAGGPDAQTPHAAGWVMRITRGSTRALTRVQIVPLGADGSAIVPPPPSEGPDAEAGYAHLRDALSAAGLDDAERDAFLVAWNEALFGSVGLGALQAPGGSATGPGDPGYAAPLGRDGVGAGLVGTLGGGAGLGFHHALGSVADALVYLVPQPSVDALLPLDIEPAPRAVRRVFLARVEITRPQVRLTFQAVATRGGLEPEVARRVLRRNVAALARCLNSAGPFGTLTVELRVLTTGAVERATLAGLELDPVASACLLERLRSVRFPESDSVMELSAPITVRR